MARLPGVYACPKMDAVILQLPDCVFELVVRALPRAADWRCLAVCCRALHRRCTEGQCAAVASMWYVFAAKEFPLLLTNKKLEKLTGLVDWGAVFHNLHNTQLLVNAHEVFANRKPLDSPHARARARGPETLALGPQRASQRVPCISWADAKALAELCQRSRAVNLCRAGEAESLCRAACRLLGDKRFAAASAVAATHTSPKQNAAQSRWIRLARLRGRPAGTSADDAVEIDD